MSSSFLIEWLFRGLENFRYVTIRSILVKTTYVIFVFIFIKKPEDYHLYFLLTSLTFAINALINTLYSRKFVNYSLNIRKIFLYAKSLISIGIYSILVALYTTFNILFLGFVSTDKEVGFFYSATLVLYILLAIITAYTNVIMPRLSSLYASNNSTEFNDKIQDSFELICAISFPLVIGCFSLRHILYH